MEKPSTYVEGFEYIDCPMKGLNIQNEQGKEKEECGVVNELLARIYIKLICSNDDNSNIF